MTARIKAFLCAPGVILCLLSPKSGVIPSLELSGWTLILPGQREKRI